MQLVIAALLAILVGLSLGLLGGGGSILTLPMLVYVLHVDAKSAIAGSLFVVGLTSAVGVAMHARSGAVRARVGLLVGGAGMVGALLGARVGRAVPSSALLIAFALVMVATALAMMRGRRAASAPAQLRPARAVAIGVAVGAVSGLVGAGGGFLVVPALALFGGLEMRQAIGTSLLVIALQSAAGFATHLASGTPIPWTLVSVVTVAAVLGSVVGARLARHVSATALRSGFGWFVLAMASFMVGKEIGLEAGVAVAALGAGASVLLRRLARGARVPRPEEV